MSSWFEPSELFATEAEGFRPDASWVVKESRGFAGDGDHLEDEGTGQASAKDPVYQEGYAAGRASAPWTEIESVRTLSEALGNALAQAEGLRTTYLRENRRAALEIAVSVVEGVLGRELRGNAESLEAVVAEALSEFESDGEPPELFLSEEDLTALNALEEGENRQLPTTLSRRVDQALSPGVVELRRSSDAIRIDPEEFASRLRERLLPLIAGLPSTDMPETEGA